MYSYSLWFIDMRWHRQIIFAEVLKLCRNCCRFRYELNSLGTVNGMLLWSYITSLNNYQMCLETARICCDVLITAVPCAVTWLIKLDDLFAFFHFKYYEHLVRFFILYFRVSNIAHFLK